MQDTPQFLPEAYLRLEKVTKSSGFTMGSDRQTGSLLRTLAASKQASRCLELGTGTGLSTAWILAGLDTSSSLVSIDNDATFLKIAQTCLADDERLTLIHADGGEWIEANQGQRFDYIFADTWPGKYVLLDKVLTMLNKGGFYIIDDMMAQPTWPEGHEAKARALVEDLENRDDLVITKQSWATGIVIAVKV